MVRENWNILANTFEVKTRNSYRKCFVFAERHYGALKGQSTDAVIAPIYSSFEPVYLDFANEYAKWNMLKGEQEGATLDFTQTLLLISKKLKEWEGQIYFHYPEDTEDAVAIFPHKRTPFYKGSYIVRTEAVNVLINQLAKYPALGAVKTNVETYYALLHGKLMTHICATFAVTEQSHLLERKRKAICAEMYGNLGLLMHYYRHNITFIKNYFDMGVLKNRVHRKKKEKK